jgi:hypothetical protein
VTLDGVGLTSIKVQRVCRVVPLSLAPWQRYAEKSPRNPEAQ